VILGAALLAGCADAKLLVAQWRSGRCSSP
jgi:hypothetical protein